MTKQITSAFIFALIALQPGCGGADSDTEIAATEESEAQPTSAQAQVLNASGDSIGDASFEETADGVRIHLTATFLEPGSHGFHIHEVGTCDVPTFGAAGGHFNPSGAPHGMNTPGGPHAGDLQNIEVGEDGTTELDRILSGVTIQPGDTSIAGRALVIHAKPDDYVSQPSGDAGDRVACGVIQPSNVVDIG